MSLRRSIDRPKNLDEFFEQNLPPRKRFARGSYIRRWRSNLGLTYEEVADTLGVDPVTVRNWEKSPSIKPIVKLAFDRAFRDNAKRVTIRTRSGLKTRWGI